MKNILTFLALIILSTLSVPAYATKTAAATKSAVEYTKPTAKEARKEKRAIKKAEKLKDKMADIDLNDPVDKWMWFWIIGWGASIVLAILGVPVLPYLLGTAGTVSLIIWLVKVFS